MNNALQRADFRLSMSFNYVRYSVDAPQPRVPATFRELVEWQVSSADPANTPGVATKGHAVTTTIAPSGTLSLDLDALTDLFSDVANWAAITALIVSHDSDSVATETIEITGAITNAISGIKSSTLYKDEICVPYYSRLGIGRAVGTTGGHVLAIKNNDTLKAATVTVFIEGK